VTFNVSRIFFRPNLQRPPPPPSGGPSGPAFVTAIWQQLVKGLAEVVGQEGVQDGIDATREDEKEEGEKVTLCEKDMVNEMALDRSLPTIGILQQSHIVCSSIS